MRKHIEQLGMHRVNAIDELFKVVGKLLAAGMVDCALDIVDHKGEAFDPLEHQAVGRVEDAAQYDETVNDVYQKGYRMADRILRSAMVTVTYGGEKRPAPEPEAAPEDAAADTAESAEE